MHEDHDFSKDLNLPTDRLPDVFGINELNQYNPLCYSPDSTRQGILKNLGGVPHLSKDEKFVKFSRHEGTYGLTIEAITRFLQPYYDWGAAPLTQENVKECIKKSEEAKYIIDVAVTMPQWGDWDNPGTGIKRIHLPKQLEKKMPDLNRQCLPIFDASWRSSDNDDFWEDVRVDGPGSGVILGEEDYSGHSYVGVANLHVRGDSKIGKPDDLVFNSERDINRMVDRLIFLPKDKLPEDLTTKSFRTLDDVKANIKTLNSFLPRVKWALKEIPRKGEEDDFALCAENVQGDGECHITVRAQDRKTIVPGGWGR